MSNLFKISLLFLVITFGKPAASFAQAGAATKYKCMIQMTNYMGEGAYEKTLYVMGPDKKWYNSLKEWNKFRAKKPVNISAITGASVTGGDRSVNTIEIENSKINAGYKLRFESAVEDKNYNVKDVEIPLTTEGLAAKSEGSGYIRYVRFSPN